MKRPRLFQKKPATTPPTASTSPDYAQMQQHLTEGAAAFARIAQRLLEFAMHCDLEAQVKAEYAQLLRAFAVEISGISDAMTEGALESAQAQKAGALLRHLEQNDLPPRAGA